MKFYKYQGTGNDFVMIDDRENKFTINQEIIANICDRRFGVGADGLILLREIDEHFHMFYFNSDGRESTMCGNGGRCFVKFLSDLKLIENKLKFFAKDGGHFAEINNGIVRLQMQDVDNIIQKNDYLFLDTGSPHHVVFVEDVSIIDVKKNGAEIRYSNTYPDGTNVNFVQVLTNNRLNVRTYERGVEDETYSCGTGVTAATLAYATLDSDLPTNEMHIKTKGGNLLVSYEKTSDGFNSIFLSGPASFVFKGKIKL